METLAQIVPLVAGVIRGIVSVLDNNEAPEPIVESLRALALVLEEGDDVIEELEGLRAEVEQMAAEGRGPTVERMQALQVAADNAMSRIQAAVEAKKAALELPGDDAA